MIGNFQQKLNNLPFNIRKIFFSEYQRIISLNLRKKYNLSHQQGSLLEEIITSLYFNEEKFTNLVSLVSGNLHIDKNTAINLSKDVIGQRFLIAKSYFKELNNDPVLVLNSLGGKESDYANDILILQKAIKDEDLGIYDHDNYLYKDEPLTKVKTFAVPENKISESDLSTEERFEAIKNILEQNLLDILLSDDNSDTTKEINDALIQVLNELPASQTEIEKIISNNKASLTQGSLTFDEKEVLPTASMWLKDFQKYMGTEKTDSLLMTHYFIESINAKTLSEKDRKIIRKFLLLHNNIKFFRQVFNNVPVEMWHIIPVVNDTSVDHEERPFFTPSHKISQIKKPISFIPPSAVVSKKSISSTPQVSNISTVKSQVSLGNGSKTTSAVIPSQVTDSDEIMSLKNLLLQYPVDSLERKAIEEEIKNLSL